MTLLNPALDLELTRLIAAPPAKVWRCWTEPDLVKQWFTPRPVLTTQVEIDLRPGGRFFTLMVMPDGTEMPADGCVLEVETEHRLTFTDTLGADFRPVATPGLGFTAVLTFVPEAGGTRYTARVLHGTAEARDTHDELGFHDGWGAAAAQLEALAATL